MKKGTVGRIIVVILLIASLTYSFVISMEVGNNKNEAKPMPHSTPDTVTKTVLTGKTQTVETEEFRAVWVPFMSLTLESDKSEAAFKQKFDEILSNTVAMGLNTVIVHVRPFSDALYKSSYYPWSHILTGVQGKNPGFDPLEYMVKASHDKNIKIHAWINPFRVKIDSSPTELAENNPAIKWKDTDYIVKWNGGIYLNPAYSEVRKLIIDGVREIVTGYDVDGIHFDDYFYPTSENDFDKTAYENYKNSLNKQNIPLTLNEWRTANVNTLITGVYSAIHSLKSNVVFGIAPQGNIDNDKNMGADIYSWCSVAGYIDYICPQLYVNFDHKLLPFDDTADTWKQLVKNKNVKLYLGLGLYKAGSDDDDGTWQKSDSIIKSQIEYCRKIGANGFALYSYDYITGKQTEKEIKNAMAILN